MKLFKLIFVIVLLFTSQTLKSSEIDLQNKISKNLRCLICQGQSIYDSDSEFALSLKIVIQNKIDGGFSEKEIYKYLAEKYGEWILFDPEFKKNTYILWILPLLIFLIGGAILFKNFIKIKN